MCFWSKAKLKKSMGKWKKSRQWKKEYFCSTWNDFFPSVSLWVFFILSKKCAKFLSEILFWNKKSKWNVSKWLKWNVSVQNGHNNCFNIFWTKLLAEFDPNYYIVFVLPKCILAILLFIRNMSPTLMHALFLCTVTCKDKWKNGMI